MRFFVYLSLWLSIAVAVAPSSNAQGNMKNFRIQRGHSDKHEQKNSDYSTPGNTNGYTYMQPLTGGIEHREAELDPQNEYAPLRPRQGYSNQLNAGTDATQLKARTDGHNLKSGLFDKMLPLIPGIPSQDLPPIPKQERLASDVNDNELKVLKSRDLVIMQDRSSSMGEKEYFPDGKFPRWYWCLSQAMDLRRQSAKIPDWTFNLVMFSSQYDLYRNVRMDMLPSVFDRNHIWIGTKLADPMAQQLSEYFQRRDAQKGRAKPLVVAVVTDGKPQDEHNLADVIINATHHMQNPNEIQIVFLQVGTDDESYKKLSKLDNRLTSRGARFDIVSVMPFHELTNTGLTRALVRVAQGTRH